MRLADASRNGVRPVVEGVEGARRVRPGRSLLWLQPARRRESVGAIGLCDAQALEEGADHRWRNVEAACQRQQARVTPRRDSALDGRTLTRCETSGARRRVVRGVLARGVQPQQAQAGSDGVIAAAEQPGQRGRGRRRAGAARRPPAWSVVGPSGPSPSRTSASSAALQRTRRAGRRAPRARGPQAHRVDRAPERRGRRSPAAARRCRPVPGR